MCRDVIADAGWGDAFMHSTGHGVGLDIHEAPAVSATSTDTLAAGHVVTVEPGVYLPEHGGVRIEDTVVVTADGCRPLTHAPKDLQSHGNVSTNDLKNGMTLDLPEGLFKVVEFQHVKPGKGGAFVRTKLKNVRTGAVRRPHVPRRREGRAGDHRQARDAVPLPRRRATTCSWTTRPTTRSTSTDAHLGDAAQLPQGGRHRGAAAATATEIVGVDLPASVELTVTETEPGVQGDRVSGARKPATLETGLVRAGAAVRQPGRAHQGRHPHRRVHHRVRR